MSQRASSCATNYHSSTASKFSVACNIHAFIGKRGLESKGRDRVSLLSGRFYVTKSASIHATIALLDPPRSTVSSDRFPFKRPDRSSSWRSALSARDKANWLAALRSFVATTSQRDAAVCPRQPMSTFRAQTLATTRFSVHRRQTDQHVDDDRFIKHSAPVLHVD